MAFFKRTASLGAAVAAWLALGGTAAAECLPAGNAVTVTVAITNNWGARWVNNGWDRSVRVVVRSWDGLAGLVQEFRIPDRSQHTFRVWAAPNLRLEYYLEDANFPEDPPFPFVVSLSDVMRPLLAKAPACAGPAPVTLPMSFFDGGPDSGPNSMVQFYLDGVLLNPRPGGVIHACPHGESTC